MHDRRKANSHVVLKVVATALRASRPVVLAALAALAFAILLRWHHGVFKKDMVENFQRYQSDAAHAIAGSIEGMFGEVAKHLRVISAYPEIRDRAPGTQRVIDASYQTYKDIARAVLVYDARGAVIYHSSAEGQADGEAAPLAEALSASMMQGGEPQEAIYDNSAVDGTVRILVPIRAEGRVQGMVGCQLDLRSFLGKCLSRSEGARKSLCCAFDRYGRNVYGSKDTPGGDTTTAPAESHERRIGPFVVDQCIKLGRTEVAEIADAAGASMYFTCTPFILGDCRYGLAVGTPKSDISVPLNSHERVIYALIGALAMLYFATGYLSYRSEKANTELAEQRRLAAEAANRAKSDFLARMSHEIRTPMNGVLGMTELVLDTDLTAQQRRCLDLAKRSAESLLTVINDILDISKIEAGKFKLSQVTFDPRACLADTIEPFRLRAAAEELELDLHVSDNVPPMVVGDPGRLRQIVTNLVGNAMKFTKHGRVGLRACADSPAGEGTVLRFEVADTGIGIPADRQKKIFDAFEQADGTVSRKYGGTGLGLAISAQLIEMMGGRIWLTSQVGKGTTFYFTARFQLPGPAAAEGQCPSRQGVLVGLPVLVADGDQAATTHLKHVLGAWHMKPTCVADGQAALAELRQAAQKGRPFPLVLLEAVLAGHDSFDLARQIQQDESLACPAVLLMAAVGLRGDAARCQEAGVAAYLTHPVDSTTLHQVLSRVVSRRAEGRSAELITRFELRTTQTHALAAAQRRLRILLADDNEVNREHATLLLHRWGHEVRCAENGREALALLRAEPFDLVLMDLQMPEMDGLEATAALREQEKQTGRHMPVIAMTADAMNEVQGQCLRAGMDRYVSKPIRPELLLEAIRAVLPIQAAEPAVGAAQDAPPPEAPPEIFDHRDALEHVGGSAATLARLERILLGEAPASLADIAQAVRNADAQTVRKGVHRLRGSLALLGAARACRQAEQLGAAARQADWELAGAAMAALEAEMTAFRQQVEVFLATEENATC
jgi:signal transduction histidine kinase/DNA-binding response OmpR family regulator